MFSQYYVDYDHKPRSHYFGDEDKSSERVTTNRVIETNKSFNEFIDFFVSEFFGEEIIETINRKNETIYFCFYCNNYIKELKKVREHIHISSHIMRKRKNLYNKGLNKKFVMKSINNTDFDTINSNEKTEIINKELDGIPNDRKHYFSRRGIRLMDAFGDFAYYCKVCEKPISSYNLILNHLSTESHKNLENRESLLDLIRNGKQIPIIGLNLIKEYNNSSMDVLLYECTLCHVFQSSYQMYSHLFEFKHQINVLNHLQNTTFQWIPETELNFKIKEWYEKKGMGFIERTKEMPNTYCNNMGSGMEQIRAIFGSLPNSCNSIQRLFAVKIQSNSDVQKVIQIVESLKEASIKYYSLKKDQNLNSYY